jgi:hypothetical protein
MAVISAGYLDEQRCKKKVKNKGNNINGPFFVGRKKEPETDKGGVDNKENKKAADISKCLLWYMREDKPSNPAAENYDPQTDKSNINSFYTGFYLIPLCFYFFISILAHF